ncbi:MAG: hypothetical protein JXA89_14205 [Anaerolineae bacterium]|nr:hypothetical protein [Anaerolineae bacterium]
MNQITLKEIYCYDTDDLITDELLLQVFVDGQKRTSLRKKMRKHSTWFLFQSFVFDKTVQLRLWDRQLGRDDFLGQADISHARATNKMQYFEPNPTSSYRLAYSVTDLDATTTANVGRDGRVLLVAGELVSGGDPEIDWLYEFLQSKTISLAQAILSKHYRKIETLAESDFTRDAFVAKLKAMAEDDRNQAVDVILAPHGLDERLYFYNNQIVSAPALSRDIAGAITGIAPKTRLRMLYSTACYGAQHANDFVNVAGFRVASGAVAVNTNAAIEYPAFLTRWGAMSSFQTAITISSELTAIQDWLAERFASSMDLDWDANSTKVIMGKARTYIWSQAE